MIKRIYSSIGSRRRVSLSLLVLLLTARGLGAEEATPPSLGPVAAPPPPAQVASPLKPEPKGPPLARVGDHVITLTEFMDVVRADPNLYKQLSLTQEKARVLRLIIDNHLLEVAALERAGLPRDAPEEAREEAVQRLVKEELTADEVSDEQLAAAWAARKDAMGIPAAVHIREIFFPVPAQADPAVRQAARAKAEGALQRARSGESFEGLARELAHLQALRDIGGDQGFLPLTQYPYLARVTAGLREGDIGEIVELPGGYQVFQFLGRSEAILLPYEAARDRLRQDLVDASQADKKARFLEGYAQKVGVEILAPELGAAWPQGATQAVTQ